MQLALQARGAPDVQFPDAEVAVLAGRGGAGRSRVERDAGDAAGVPLELHRARAPCEGLVARPAQLPELQHARPPFANTLGNVQTGHNSYEQNELKS